MKKVLLIEDDRIMRENTAEILELAGYQVETADNGKTGVEQARRFVPDIILCDIMMPGLDGYGVLHVLSKDTEIQDTPFIFLTAKAEKSDLRKGMELGADDYLTKPFDDTELLNAIETRLRKFKKLTTKEVKKNIINWDDFRSQFPPHKVKKKQIVFSEGDNAEYLYYLNSGQIKLYKTHDDGKELVLDVVNSGGYFGQSSFFLGDKNNCHALAMLDAEIVKIPKNEFSQVLLNNPEIAQSFISSLSENIKSTEEKLLSFAYDTVRKRIANAILNLSDENKSLKISREDLANYVGTATETLIRCLSEFKEDQLIKIEKRVIEIVDKKTLEEIRY